MNPESILLQAHAAAKRAVELEPRSVSSAVLYAYATVSLVLCYCGDSIHLKDGDMRAEVIRQRVVSQGGCCSLSVYRPEGCLP